MAKFDLKSFIIPTTLQNADANGKNGDSSFDTTDLIYIDDYSAVKNVAQKERVCYPTDYAVMNGAVMSGDNNGSEKRRSCWTWLRSAYSDGTVLCVHSFAFLYGCYVDDTCVSLRPALQLNLSSVISARSASGDVFKISAVKDKEGKVVCHTIEFGEYPKTYVGDKLNEHLESEISRGSLVATGKKYTGHFDNNGIPAYNEEYMYEGKKFVRVLSVRKDSDSKFLDGTMVPKDGTPLWVKVEPIIWKIRNWDEMPREINPKGTGKAKFIDVRTEEAIATLPFHTERLEENCNMWQNSTIRGYLNGINVNNITTNGNPAYSAPNGGDFREQNFLTEAFERTIENIKTNKSNKAKKKPRKGYGVQIQENPMTVNEQIKFYIENGMSFMLHGPSGVGKSRRIKELDPDYIPLELTKNMIPEEAKGKTVYPNNELTGTGIMKLPAWYGKLCEKCAKEPNKKHILFIDEITNVKSEQGLVYHLLLHRSIGPNIGLLPENAVVVAAGNNQAESEAAYNMVEPLFRRFVGHIYLELNLQEWLEWGSQKSDKEGRLKIHPLVSSFVSTYGDKVFYTEYDAENPPKYAIDPRGWEQISDIIYDNKGVIARELIENKVGKEIASNLIAFAKIPPIMIEDVIESNYEKREIPTNFDAKYALALSLRHANFEQIQKVREFINKELGEEILSMFDSIWTEEDDEKALFLANLPEIDEK